MVNKRKLYIVSTIFALSIYLLLLSFVIKVIFDRDEDILKVGFDVNDSITIELKEIPQDSKFKQNKKLKNNKKEKLIKISQSNKKSKSDSRDIKSNNIKTLFSTVRVTKNANEVEEKIKKEKTRASRLKKINAKELFQNTLNEKNIVSEDKLLKIKQILKSTKNNKIKGEYDNKYIAKISDIIMKRWQNTIATKDGLSASVIVKIDKNGKLTYSNLKPSLNELFDAKLKEFLKELTKINFPKYQSRFGDPFIEVKIIFKDKEEK